MKRLKPLNGSKLKNVENRPERPRMIGMTDAFLLDQFIPVYSDVEVGGWMCDQQRHCQYVFAFNHMIHKKQKTVTVPVLTNEQILQSFFFVFTCFLPRPGQFSNVPACAHFAGTVLQTQGYA
jgi:hypothetical protein